MKKRWLLPASLVIAVAALVVVQPSAVEANQSYTETYDDALGLLEITTEISTPNGCSAPGNPISWTHTFRNPTSDPVEVVGTSDLLLGWDEPGFEFPGTEPVSSGHRHFPASFTIPPGGTHSVSNTETIPPLSPDKPSVLQTGPRWFVRLTVVDHPLLTLENTGGLTYNGNTAGFSMTWASIYFGECE